MKEDQAQKVQLSPPPKPAVGEPTKLENSLNDLAERWWARYVVGALLFVAGGFLLDHFIGLEPGKRWNTYVHYWLSMFTLFGWGIICMKELFRFAILALVFGGLAYAFFGLIASIPVSLAIIIGAVIIANSNSRN